MDICKTDYMLICRYLDEGAEIISSSTDRTRWLDRARLMRRLAHKLKKKIG